MGRIYQSGVIGLLIITAFSLFSGCDVSTSEREKPETESLNKDRETIELIFGRLPHPNVISSKLEASGTDFDWTFLGIGNYPRPERDTLRAILSGILLSDVSYFIAFDQGDLEKPYFERLNILSGNMCQISKDEQDLLNSAFSASINRRDSLQFLLDQIYFRTTKSLQNGSKNDLSTLFAVASVTENLFITTSLINSYPNDILAEDSRSIILLPLIRTLLEQEPYLEDAMLLLEQGSQSSLGSNLLEHLRIVDSQFDQLNVEENLRNRRVDLVMADSTFIKMRKEIVNARMILYEELE
ncbi:hypothetical protein [Fulvivirga sedimenti]|uniref:Lipoprotein n=1 Tax=Fulvivirga sedimenti TaxID=2879465 RepID=A0A9X1HP27_9BACT|nr:hypothetical protein [Fulvivirga sedimenti]MCA6073552.1 hypothetical protein [Fulvivirga sedimenti]